MNVKNSRTRLIFIGIICIAFLGILLIINEVLENKFEISKNTEKNTKEYGAHIALIQSNSDEELWASLYKGAKSVGEEKNIYFENFGEGFVEDYSVAELVEMAVAARVDGIIVQPDGRRGLEEQIQSAHKENIPLMTIFGDLPGSERISFVSGNDYTVGVMYGNQIAEEVEKRWENSQKPVKVTVLMKPGTEESPNLIYSGIHEATISLSEKMELTTSVIGHSGEFESEETVRNLLLDQNPPDVLACLNPIDTISAYQSVVDYNRVGQTTIIGYYSSEDTMEGIQKGIIKSSVLIDANELGKTVAEGMCEYLETGSVSEYLTVPPTLITKENLEKYKSEEK